MPWAEVEVEEVVWRVAEADADAIKVWEAYSAVERVYVGALRAMGVLPEVKQSVSNSAGVHVSFTPYDKVS